jgi:molecular chaperone DnaJ
VSARDYLEKDFYAVLGVAKDASADEIKKTYRKLARQYHPDTNVGDAAAEERFKEISEAYDVLSDETKRREYDEARALFGSGGPGGFRFGPGGGPGGASFQGFDLGDIFAQAGGASGSGLGDLLGGMFGQRGGRTQRPRRGADVESTVTLGFREAVHGVTLPLRLSTEAACPTCLGSGARPGTTPHSCAVCGGAGQTITEAGGFGFPQPCRACRGRGQVVDDPCPDCTGSGRATKSRSIQVRVPAGVKDGQRIRIKGKGAPGESGGPAGDLYVVVNVKPHPVFGRKGEHLTISVPVTFPEAALGATITVPTLDGDPVRVKVPAGTPSGRTLRVRGKGAPTAKGGTGDLLVTIDVAVPQKVKGAAKDALNAYAEATAADDPRADLFPTAQHD